MFARTALLHDMESALDRGSAAWEVRSDFASVMAASSASRDADVASRLDLLADSSAMRVAGRFAADLASAVDIRARILSDSSDTLVSSYSLAGR